MFNPVNVSVYGGYLKQSLGLLYAIKNHGGSEYLLNGKAGFFQKPRHPQVTWVEGFLFLFFCINIGYSQ
jgi:hypothetical protein